jgi:hypothetical protein
LFSRNIHKYFEIFFIPCVSWANTGFKQSEYKNTNTTGKYSIKNSWYMVFSGSGRSDVWTRLGQDKKDQNKGEISPRTGHCQFKLKRNLHLNFSLRSERKLAQNENDSDRNQKENKE